MKQYKEKHYFKKIILSKKTIYTYFKIKGKYHGFYYSLTYKGYYNMNRQYSHWEHQWSNVFFYYL